MGAASDSADSQPTRAYHHGNLRETLIAAGVELAREGGLDAIVLREATRRAGVTPRAAYRHFSDRDALVVEVARVGLTRMTDHITQRVSTAMSRIPNTGPAPLAAATLRAIGTGYIEFALDEPGLFATAMFGLVDMAESTPGRSEAPTHRSPYEALESVLGSLARAGVIPAEALPIATMSCWSLVHGFATLTTHGPLRELPRERALEIGAGVVSMFVDGLTRGTPVPDAVGTSGTAGGPGRLGTSGEADGDGASDNHSGNGNGSAPNASDSDLDPAR